MTNTLIYNQENVRNVLVSFLDVLTSCYTIPTAKKEQMRSVHQYIHDCGVVEISFHPERFDVEIDGYKTSIHTSQVLKMSWMIATLNVHLRFLLNDIGGRNHQIDRLMQLMGSNGLKRVMFVFKNEDRLDTHFILNSGVGKFFENTYDTPESPDRINVIDITGDPNKIDSKHHSSGRS